MAQGVLDEAATIRLPRYVLLARLLVATVAPSVPEDIDSDLAELERFARLEAWWLTEQLAGRHGSARLHDVAMRSRGWAARTAGECSLESSLTAPHQRAPAVVRAARAARPTTPVAPAP